VFFLAGSPLQHVKSSSAAIVAHFREPLLMDRYQVEIVNELPVAAAARPPKVDAVIGELIGREHRLDSWIGHGMMLQLGGDVLFDCSLVGGPEAADRIVAAERLGQSGANQVLQASLDRAQALGRRHVRLGADEELTDVVFCEAVLQDADAVWFRGFLKRL
jgi:hypothetical protein